MKLLSLALAAAFVAGCSQDAGEVERVDAEAVQQENGPVPEPGQTLLPKEDAQKIAIYTSIAGMGCMTAVAHRDLVLMGSKPSMARPEASQSADFSAMRSAVSGFPDLQNSVKAFRAAELECFSNPSERASEALLTRRSEVEMNLELVSERLEVKSAAQLKDDLASLKGRLASGDEASDFVSEAMIVGLEDAIKQAEARESRLQ